MVFDEMEEKGPHEEKNNSHRNLVSVLFYQKILIRCHSEMMATKMATTCPPCMSAHRIMKRKG